jgi:hypothetical protein
MRGHLVTRHTVNAANLTVNMWVILVKLITHILLPDIERTQHTPMPRSARFAGELASVAQRDGRSQFGRDRWPRPARA